MYGGLWSPQVSVALRVGSVRRGLGDMNSSEVRNGIETEGETRAARDSEAVRIYGANEA